jgi:hypothetical protein
MIIPATGPVVNVQTEISSLTHVILNSIQDLPREGGLRARRSRTEQSEFPSGIGLREEGQGDFKPRTVDFETVR